MRRLALLPPLLLVGVASAQLALAHTTLLSPWKGGGFGMFSSPNHTGTRLIRTHLLTEGGRYVVSDAGGELGTRTWPRRAALRSLARQAACQAWTLVPLDSLGDVALSAPEWARFYAVPVVRERTELAGVALPADTAGASLVGAEVSVVWVGFDVETSSIRARELASERVAGCDR